MENVLHGMKHGMKQESKFSCNGDEAHFELCFGGRIIGEEKNVSKIVLLNSISIHTTIYQD